MAKHIRCAECRFVRADVAFSEEYWTAFECGNSKSEYFRGLLNVDIHGNQLNEITWLGCAEGRCAE